MSPISVERLVSLVRQVELLGGPVGLGADNSGIVGMRDNDRWEFIGLASPISLLRIRGLVAAAVRDEFIRAGFRITVYTARHDRHAWVLWLGNDVAAKIIEHHNAEAEALCALFLHVVGSVPSLGGKSIPEVLQ